MDFSPLGGSNSSVGLKKMRAKEKSFLSESHVILSVGEVIGVTPLYVVWCINGEMSERCHFMFFFGTQSYC